MKRTLTKYKLPESALKYVLEALIPYSDANLKIAFQPKLFFADLEKIDKQKQWRKEKGLAKNKIYKVSSIKQAYYQARRDKLIATNKDGKPELTTKGKKAIKPYRPKYLGKNSHILVTFDIAEKNRHKRNELRMLLKELEFKPIQRSVWMSNYDHRKILIAEIKNLNIEKQVCVFEAVKL